MGGRLLITWFCTHHVGGQLELLPNWDTMRSAHDRDSPHSQIRLYYEQQQREPSDVSVEALDLADSLTDINTPLSGLKKISFRSRISYIHDLNSSFGS